MSETCTYDEDRSREAFAKGLAQQISGPILSSRALKPIPFAKRIFLLEDGLVNATIVIRTLTTNGYTVSWAKTSTELNALMRTTGKSVDVVAFDLDLSNEDPVNNGMAVAQKLDADLPSNSGPCFVLFSDRPVNDERRALARKMPRFEPLSINGPGNTEADELLAKLDTHKGEKASSKKPVNMKSVPLLLDSIRAALKKTVQPDAKNRPD